MTPAAIIAIIKDIVIVGGLIFIGWFIWSDGANRVEKSDLNAVIKEIKQNAETEKGWRDQKDSADETLRSDLAKINDPGAKPKPPVWVCAAPKPTGPVAVSGDPRSTPNVSSGIGSGDGVDRGSDNTPVNRRSQLDAAERQIETWFAECRDFKSSYPKKLLPR